MSSQLPINGNAFIICIYIWYSLLLKHFIFVRPFPIPETYIHTITNSVDTNWLTNSMPSFFQECVLTNANSVTKLSPSGARSNLTPRKSTTWILRSPTRSAVTRCTFARNVGIPPATPKHTTSISRRTILTVQHLWSVMINGSLNSRQTVYRPCWLKSKKR